MFILCRLQLKCVYFYVKHSEIGRSERGKKTKPAMKPNPSLAGLYDGTSPTCSKVLCSCSRISLVDFLSVLSFPVIDLQMNIKRSLLSSSMLHNAHRQQHCFEGNTWARFPMRLRDLVHKDIKGIWNMTHDITETLPWQNVHSPQLFWVADLEKGDCVVAVATASMFVASSLPVDL